MTRFGETSGVVSATSGSIVNLQVETGTLTSLQFDGTVVAPSLIYTGSGGQAEITNKAGTSAIGILHVRVGGETFFLTLFAGSGVV